MTKTKKRRRSRVRKPGASRLPIMEPATFINIDVDVRSRRSLAPLRAAWPWAQQPVQNNARPDPRWMVFSANSTAGTAEGTARALIEMVTVLPPAARKAWNLASKRTFDIGVRAGTGLRAFEEVQISPETLARIAALGARLQVTVYPPRPA